MKYSILFFMLFSHFSFSDVNFREIDLFKVLRYQTHQPSIQTSDGIISPRILIVGMGRDRCFYVVKRTRSGERSQRNCKFLLTNFPESIRDENMPKSNIVDFEKSDLNSETEVNLIKHINIKENGDIVFTYNRGVGAKSALYFCTQKLNHEDEGLAENPIPECEFIERGDFDGEFRKIYDMFRDEFYPAR